MEADTCPCPRASPALVISFSTTYTPARCAVTSATPAPIRPAPRTATLRGSACSPVGFGYSSYFLVPCWRVKQPPQRTRLTRQARRSSPEAARAPAIPPAGPSPAARRRSPEAARAPAIPPAGPSPAEQFGACACILTECRCCCGRLVRHGGHLALEVIGVGRVAAASPTVPASLTEARGRDTAYWTEARGRDTACWTEARGRDTACWTSPPAQPPEALAVVLRGSVRPGSSLGLARKQPDQAGRLLLAASGAGGGTETPERVFSKGGPKYRVTIGPATGSSAARRRPRRRASP